MNTQPLSASCVPNPIRVLLRIHGRDILVVNDALCWAQYDKRSGRAQLGRPGTCSAFVAPLAVNAANVIIIDAAPPAYEQMPARQGYIITPGYYRYEADRSDPTWVKGEYLAERRGEHYVGSEWRAQDGKFHFTEGRSAKDQN